MRMSPSLASATACAFLISGSLAFPATANSLPELLKRPVRGTYNSSKGALALEHCIGEAVSDWGFPHILHGEGVTDLWVGPPYAIRIVDDGSARRVSFTATAAYDDRIATAIGGCL